MLAKLFAGPAGEWIKHELSGQFACDVDQAWVRRQYGPQHYPAFHAPHGWHQDGALGFDFLSHENSSFPPDAILPMVTCWIALSPCGAEAPGLELVTQRLETLLAPMDLADARVRTRFTPELFWQPVMEPGDALLFRGDILHRTYVTSAMTKDRTSIELRLFPADNLPPRIKDDRFVRLD
jgi:ectoine hydroxylase-related dioxygenase (phytanoyl-CoA dioxygenase family)